MINQVLDLRVEDIVLNPLFFKEILDFATSITLQDDAPFKLKINPLLRSIGFLESLHFLRELLIS